MVTSTKRLFTALTLSADFVTELTPSLKKLRVGAEKREIDVQWISTKNLHITLNYLGPTSIDALPQIISTIESQLADTYRFKLRIENAGAFPDLLHARTLWLGVQRKHELVILQEKLAQSLTEFGSASPESPYSPHLTLGKMRKSRQVKDLLSPLRDKRFGYEVVAEVALFESVVTEKFPIYKKIHLFPLLSESSL